MPRRQTRTRIMRAALNGSPLQHSRRLSASSRKWGTEPLVEDATLKSCASARLFLSRFKCYVPLFLQVIRIIYIYIFSRCCNCGCRLYEDAGYMWKNTVLLLLWFISHGKVLTDHQNLQETYCWPVIGSPLAFLLQKHNLIFSSFTDIYVHGYNEYRI